MPYFSGQGKVRIAQRDASGNALAFRYLGNCSALTLSPTTDVLTHKESVTGQRLTDLRLLREKNVNLNIQMQEFSAGNLAQGFYGASSVIAGSTVVAEEFPTVAVGDFVRTAQQDLTNIVVKDSDGAPATLVLDTDYRIESAKHGTIEFLNLGAYTQPFTIDYTYAGATNINMFTQALPERWMRFEGLNTADSNAPVLIEVFRVALDPINEAQLISDEILNMELPGSALYDSTKDNDAVLGQFGIIRQIAA
jgi:hypothetical protein